MDVSDPAVHGKARRGRPRTAEPTGTITVRLPVREIEEIGRRAEKAGLSPMEYARQELRRRLAHRPGQATRKRLQRA